jgi:hypothetical protein
MRRDIGNLGRRKTGLSTEQIWKHFSFNFDNISNEGSDLKLRYIETSIVIYSVLT